MVIGEAPLMKDLQDVTDVDLKSKYDLHRGDLLDYLDYL